MFISQDVLSTWIGRKLATKYLKQHVVCNTKQALKNLLAQRMKNALIHTVTVTLSVLFLQCLFPEKNCL